MKVATIDDLDNGPKRVSVDGKKYLVCSVNGEVRAYRNVCPHQYGPAVEGMIDENKGTVICPWHGFEFDLDSGEDPAYGKSLPRANVEIRGGDVYID